jgi:peroxiredoxin
MHARSFLNRFRFAKLAILILAPSLALSGCVIHYHAAPSASAPPLDPVLQQRLALLEQRLAGLDPAAPAEAQPTQDLTPEQRVDNVEAQISRIVGALNTNHAKSGAPTEAKPSQPAAREVAPLRETELEGDRPAGRKKASDKKPTAKTSKKDDDLLVQASPDHEFGGFNFLEKRVSKNLMERLSAGEISEIESEKARRDLIGKPPRQTQYLGPSGQIVNLADFQGHKNVVLVFLRGFSGSICVGCSTQTIALSRAKDEFIARDTQVILVYPGNADSVPAFLKAVQNLADSNFDLPYPVLLDVGLRAVTAFMIEGSLANPTSMIIDKAGKVRWVYEGDGATDRPTIPTLLSELDKLEDSAPTSQPVNI